MKTPSFEKKIFHLIRLIDDHDPFVRNRVRDELLKIGEDAAPFLEIAARKENPQTCLLANEILQDLFPIQLRERFRQLKRPKRDIDLEEGAFLLMQFGYPKANHEKYRTILDELANEARERILTGLSPEGIVETLTNFLFKEKGFHGNIKDFFNPDNTYLNKVIEEKSGIPISLSALCIFVASRVGIPIYGVCMPCHFIVKYETPGNSIYFDPFHDGKLLTKDDCVQMVESFGLQFQEHYLCRSTNQEILVRMINNLVMIYRKTDSTKKAQQLGEYIKILTLP